MEYNPKYSGRMTPVLNIVEILILFLSGAAIIMGMLVRSLHTCSNWSNCTFCIGLTIQVAIVDTKFPISRKLDICKGLDRIDHSDSEKISSRIVFIFFLAFLHFSPKCCTHRWVRFSHIPIICCKSFAS